MAVIYKQTVENLSERRIDAWHYQPNFQNQIDKIKQNVGVIFLNDVIDKSRGVASGATPLGANYLQNGKVKFYRTSEVEGMFLDSEKAVYISEDDDEKLARSRLNAGDILLTITGAKFGKSAVVSELHLPGNISQHSVRFHPKPELIDSYFLVAYLESDIGQDVIWREAYGATRPAIDFPSIRALILPKVNLIAQKYIGDKVRQAELLRNLSGKINKEIYGMIACGSFINVMQTEEKKYGLATLLDLSNRLDPKYYATKAIAAERFTKDAGVKLQNLISNISNGFEERNFVQQGQIYLTVSEVSSGRIEVKSAPKISFDVEVPSKAFIKQTCVLVVRTGSIGTAVKVHALDNKAVISSHLIRLEFKEESVAAAVAIFLNSSVGKILLHKISYGAVQPQIGQDELLNLHIPDYVLEIKEKLLESLNQYEIMIRFSQVLIQISKILVESLIEGNITEEELIKAQNALEQGDKSLDRAILSQMTEDGYAVAGSKPLFSDLDEFYDLLEQAKALE